MLEKRTLKNDFCLVLCCGISVSVISGIVFWLDSGTASVNADVALSEATRSIESYCAKNMLASCDLQLMDATAPKTTVSGRGDTGWNFDFYSPRTGYVTVEVHEKPDEKLFSRVVPGNPDDPPPN